MVSLASSNETLPPTVSLRGFTRRFGENTVLDNLDLDIQRGEFVALLGRSGSGKTTLLRTLAGLDPVTEGEITVPSARAVVFQEPRLMPWKRVWKNVVLGLNVKALNGPAGARERALAALEEVSLGHRIDAWPATLSGGEAQRAALARALVREPQLLLLDEPFASLDALSRIRMHKLVSELCRVHSPAVLLVTHDVDEAILLADRILVLAEGKFISDLRIDIAQPRHAGHPSFIALRRHLLREIGVETDEPEDIPLAEQVLAGE